LFLGCLLPFEILTPCDRYLAICIKNQEIEGLSSEGSKVESYANLSHCMPRLHSIMHWLPKVVTLSVLLYPNLH